MKKIILTESQIDRVINNLVTERLGVPENLVDASLSLFEQIASQIENLNYNRPDDVDDDDRTYEFRVDGKYQIKDQSYTKVNVKIIVTSIDHPEVQRPVLQGMHHEGGTKPSPDFKYLKHEKTIDDVTIGITFYVPENWKGPMSELSEVLRSDQGEFASSITHELMHSYDTHKSPTENIYARADYTSAQRVHTHLTPVDELFQYVYYIHKIENTVRPAELAAQMKTQKVTKDTFLNFINNNKIIQRLNKIKKLTYEDFKQQIMSNPEEMNNILNNPDFPKDFDVKTMDDNEKVELLLKLGYNGITDRKGHTFAKMLTTNGMENIIGPAAFPPEKKEVFIKYLNYIQKFQNNPLGYYQYEIKRLNAEAEKMYRKLVKLYDLL